MRVCVSECIFYDLRFYSAIRWNRIFKERKFALAAATESLNALTISIDTTIFIATCSIGFFFAFVCLNTERELEKFKRTMIAGFHIALLGRNRYMFFFLDKKLIIACDRKHTVNICFVHVQNCTYSIVLSAHIFFAWSFVVLNAAKKIETFQKETYIYQWQWHQNHYVVRINRIWQHTSVWFTICTLCHRTNTSWIVHSFVCCICFYSISCRHIDCNLQPNRSLRSVLEAYTQKSGLTMFWWIQSSSILFNSRNFRLLCLYKAKVKLFFVQIFFGWFRPQTIKNVHIFSFYSHFSNHTTVKMPIVESIISSLSSKSYICVPVRQLIFN